eukprot:scaffold137432_cov22-Tisochrysis_lutea.AAC.1
MGYEAHHMTALQFSMGHRCAFGDGLSSPCLHWLGDGLTSLSLHWYDPSIAKLPALTACLESLSGRHMVRAMYRLLGTMHACKPWMSTMSPAVLDLVESPPGGCHAPSCHLQCMYASYGCHELRCPGRQFGACQVRMKMGLAPCLEGFFPYPISLPLSRAGALEDGPHSRYLAACFSWPYGPQLPAVHYLDKESDTPAILNNLHLVMVFERVHTCNDEREANKDQSFEPTPLRITTITFCHVQLYSLGHMNRHTGFCAFTGRQKFQHYHALAHKVNVLSGQTRSTKSVPAQLCAQISVLSNSTSLCHMYACRCRHSSSVLRAGTQRSVF